MLSEDGRDVDSGAEEEVHEFGAGHGVAVRLLGEDDEGVVYFDCEVGFGEGAVGGVRGVSWGRLMKEYEFLLNICE